MDVVAMVALLQPEEQGDIGVANCGSGRLSNGGNEACRWGSGGGGGYYGGGASGWEGHILAAGGGK